MSTNYISSQSVCEQAGLLYKERGESLGEGNGSNKIFYTTNKPIVDSNRDGVVDKDDVKVYVDGLAVVVSSINADTGKITLASAPGNGAAVTGDYDWSPIESAVVAIYHAEGHNHILAVIGTTYILPLSEVPDILKEIEKKLVAGSLLDKEYSAGGDETEDSRGQRWIEWAEEKLKDIVEGRLLLMDSNNVQLVLKTIQRGQIKGYPDSEEDDEGRKRIFAIDDKF